MNGAGVFITGTDTGIGKTIYSCALLQNLRQQGHRVAAMKPVASGARCEAAGLRNEDAVLLRQAAGGWQAYADLNPYCFAPAIAPHLAAAAAGVNIELDMLQNRCRQLRQQADVTVVEGVGGWLVPLGAGQTVADLAQALQLPVVLVVGLRLGCLNHALLSARAIVDAGLPLHGWVANCIEPDMPQLAENIATLVTWLPAPLLDVIPYSSPCRPASQPVRTDWLF